MIEIKDIGEREIRDSGVRDMREIRDNGERDR